MDDLGGKPTIFGNIHFCLNKNTPKTTSTGFIAVIYFPPPNRPEVKTPTGGAMVTPLVLCDFLVAQDDEGKDLEDGKLVSKTLHHWKLTYPTEREKENHLQKCLGRGYVSSLEGTPLKINILNIIMEVWFRSFYIVFLSKWLICRFHVNLPGCRTISQPSFLSFYQRVGAPYTFSRMTEIMASSIWRNPSHWLCTWTALKSKRNIEVEKLKHSCLSIFLKQVVLFSWTFWMTTWCVWNL